MTRNEYFVWFLFTHNTIYAILWVCTPYTWNLINFIFTRIPNKFRVLIMILLKFFWSFSIISNLSFALLYVSRYVSSVSCKFNIYYVAYVCNILLYASRETPNRHTDIDTQITRLRVLLHYLRNSFMFLYMLYILPDARKTKEGILFFFVWGVNTCIFSSFSPCSSIFPYKKFIFNLKCCSLQLSWLCLTISHSSYFFAVFFSSFNCQTDIRATTK